MRIPWVPLHLFFSQTSKISVILIIAIYTGFPVAQETDLPLLSPAELGEWQVTRSQLFQGRELYGHINGGAELYLEYGFRRLFLQDLRCGPLALRIECYQMKDPAAAFGIFSVGRGTCPPVTVLGQNSCDTPYQLSFCKADFYVTISNYEGTASLAISSAELAGKIWHKIPEQHLIVPEWVERDALKDFRHQVRFIRGPLGLQNSFPRWSDKFLNFSGFSLFLLPVDREDAWITIASIQFASSSQLLDFLRQEDLNPALPGRIHWRNNSQEKVQRTFYRTDSSAVILVEAWAEWPDIQNLFEPPEK